MQERERERERERDMEIFLLNLDRALLLVPASLSFRGEGASPRLVDVNERAFLKSDDGDRSSYKLLLHHQALADTSQGPVLRAGRIGCKHDDCLRARNCSYVLL
jgi:hypothetical protein